MKRANFFRTPSTRRSLVYRIALTAVFTALTFAATLVVQVPVPATGGYVNVGDTIIFVAGALCGPFVGGVAGGLGSMFADLVVAPFYAPFTFLIKSIEGALVGFLASVLASKIKKNVPRCLVQLCSFLVAGFTMILGYFLVEYAYYDVGGALAALPGNLIQALVSVALASALLFFCKLGERVVKNNFAVTRRRSPKFPQDQDNDNPDADEKSEPIANDTISSAANVDPDPSVFDNSSDNSEEVDDTSTVNRTTKF